MRGVGVGLPGFALRPRRRRAHALPHQRARQQRGVRRALLHEAPRLCRGGEPRAIRHRALPAGALGRGGDGDPDAGVRRARPRRPARFHPARAVEELPENPLPQARRPEEEDPLVAAVGSRLVERILVIGAAGMIGRKLTERLAKDGGLNGSKIGELVLHDVVAAPAPPFKARSIVSDLSSPGEAEKLVAERPDLIFHLAAIVSGEAEADFDKGYRINLDGTRALFEAIRKMGGGYKPRVVFTSSIAVFGAPFPEAIGDEFLNAPLTSYGTPKAIDELLLADYSRRGFFDGIALRLPTVCVRPGKPNRAASGCFSGIIREPLAGQEAILPVAESVRHWFASPRAAIGF